MQTHSLKSLAFAFMFAGYGAPSCARELEMVKSPAAPGETCRKAMAGFEHLPCVEVEPLDPIKPDRDGAGGAVGSPELGATVAGGPSLADHIRTADALSRRFTRMKSTSGQSPTMSENHTFR